MTSKVSSAMEYNYKQPAVLKMDGQAITTISPNYFHQQSCLTQPSRESSTQSRRTPSPKSSSSREHRQLHILYNKTRNDYLASTLSVSIANLLESKSVPKVTKLISLGLGSLKSGDQTRRIKQLTIFLAIAEQLRLNQANIEIYAQDPGFTKADEAFLQSLGVQILSTPSATEAGEAAKYLDESTLVYCPFLTLEAYQLFFGTGNFNLFIGDDFDALRNKWPKRSAGWNEADSVSRRFVQGLRKRVISGEGFWEAEDKPFPMALYSASQRHQEKGPRARL